MATTPNTTDQPTTGTSPSIKCPLFTYSGYDVENFQYFCEYESWAYGVFALVAILFIMVPLVCLICCITRYRTKKRYIRRLRSTVSTSDSYVTSSEQPLISEGRHHQNAVYGTIEPFSPRLSPTADSISERRSESHDNISVVSSRASMMPNFDQASLDIRNTKAANNFQNSYNYPEPLDRSEGLLSPGNAVNPYASSNVITNPNNARNKTDSPKYTVREEAALKRSTPVMNSPEYAVLEKLNEPPNNKIEKKADLPVTSDNEEKPHHVEKVNGSSTKVDLLDAEVPNNDIYNILEPTTTSNTPQQESTNESNQNPENNLHQSLTKKENDSSIDSIDNKTECNKDNETTDEPRYMPLVFPKERSSDDNGTDGSTQHSKERTKSRADYQEILLDAIKSYPLDERNGCFVVRDSISSPGAKVITVYNKIVDRQQEFYNFKICFNETGQVFLAKSMKKFSAIEELLDYLRSNKDMLPCTLRIQIA